VGSDVPASAAVSDRSVGRRLSDYRPIDPDAPWGYGNYTLSVIPWLGALTAGVVPSLNLVAPTSDSRFDYASGGVTEPLCLPAEFTAGVADWQASFELMSEHGVDILPERLLRADDNLCAPADLPEAVRKNVVNVIGLGRMPTWRYNLNLAVWKRVMRTRSARKDVVALLDAIFDSNPGNRMDRLRVVGYLLRP
jgi:hypothetical protein